jgi:hypothetical protein
MVHKNKKTNTCEAGGVTRKLIEQQKEAKIPVNTPAHHPTPNPNRSNPAPPSHGEY